MGYFIVISSLFLVFFAEASMPFSGFISTRGQHKTLKTSTGHIDLVGGNDDIKAQISKLNTDDFISGIGNTETTQIIVQSIDFIGLNRFLGLWLSPLGLLQVKDFSNLNIYSPQKFIAPNSPKSSLNYSITPGDGDSWVLFLSDANQIYFSNLLVNKKMAVIRFYNTQTGSFINEVKMSKINQ